MDADLERSPDVAAPHVNADILFKSVRELIGLIGACVGIFAALLYLAGRSYASGYFGAMNIPEYMVNFSLQEYGSVVWFPLFIYPTLVMIVSGLLWGTIYIIRDWISPWFQHLIEKIIRIIKKISPKIRLPRIGRQARWMFAVFEGGIFLGIIIVFILFTLTFVQEIGAQNGKNLVLEGAAQTELMSLTPLTLDKTSIVVTQTVVQDSQYYDYKGFRLLTLNGSMYYFFTDIDPVSCKPREVYKIGADQPKLVVLGPASSLADQCLPTK